MAKDTKKTVKDFTAEEPEEVVIDGKVVPPQFIFKSMNDMNLNVRPSTYALIANKGGSMGKQLATRAINCHFDQRTYVLNPAEAKSHGLSIEELKELLFNHDDYGKTFMLISGPGVDATEAVKEFERRVAKSLPKNIAPTQGPLNQGAVRGR
jgi:hypothetical protein